MRVFLITGASIGIAGTLAGFCLGLLIASNVESIRGLLNEAFTPIFFRRSFIFSRGFPRSSSRAMSPPSFR